MPMTDLYQEYGRLYVPFSLERADERRTRCSLGGHPPGGVVPPKVFPETRYFGTLGLEPEADVSIFSTLDPSSGPGRFDPFSHTYDLLDEASPLMQFVVHGPERSVALGSPLASPWPTLRLEFGESGMDPECTEQPWRSGECYEDNKVGGCPVFSQLERDCVLTLDLMRGGWAHVLQLFMPAAVPGRSWYFGDAAFHVFAKKRGTTYSFRCIWG